MAKKLAVMGSKFGVLLLLIAFVFQTYNEKTWAGIGKLVPIKLENRKLKQTRKLLGYTKSLENDKNANKSYDINQIGDVKSSPCAASAVTLCSNEYRAHYMRQEDREHPTPPTIQRNQDINLIEHVKLQRYLEEEIAEERNEEEEKEEVKEKYKSDIIQHNIVEFNELLDSDDSKKRRQEQINNNLNNQKAQTKVQNSSNITGQEDDLKLCLMNKMSNVDQNCKDFLLGGSLLGVGGGLATASIVGGRVGLSPTRQCEQEIRSICGDEAAKVYFNSSDPEPRSMPSYGYLKPPNSSHTSSISGITTTNDPERYSKAKEVMEAHRQQHEARRVLIPQLKFHNEKNNNNQNPHHQSPKTQPDSNQVGWSESQQAMACVAVHYNELSDLCKTEQNLIFNVLWLFFVLNSVTCCKVDHRVHRSELLPSHFLEARYYHLIQIAIIGAVVILCLPLLAAMNAFLFALNIKRHIHTINFYQNHSNTLQRTVSCSETTCSHGENILKNPPSPRHSEGISVPTLSVPTLGFLRLNYWAQHPSFASHTTGSFKIRSSVGMEQQRRKGDQKDAQLLYNVSAVIRPGQLVAVMGPSGSGKTTLLSLIAGKTRSGVFSGDRMIDGKSYSCAQYDERITQFSGFVEQNDTTMTSHWNLTVWETIAYASLLRLSPMLSIEQKLSRASAVLKLLDLASCAHTVVSGVGGASTIAVKNNEEDDEENALDDKSSTGGGGQISGGQMRRLTVALEALRSPAILFLDEPTSGLDSASSEHLVSTLATFAHGPKNKIVIATIHQPRADIFAKFDLLLLLKDGKVAFVGKPAETLGYFSAIPQVSLDPLKYDNPADFIMDALNDRHLKRPFLLKGNSQKTNFSTDNTEFRDVKMQNMTIGSDGVGKHNETYCVFGFVHYLINVCYSMFQKGSTSYENMILDDHDDIGTNEIQIIDQYQNGSIIELGNLKHSSQSKIDYDATSSSEFLESIFLNHSLYHDNNSIIMKSIDRQRLSKQRPSVSQQDHNSRRLQPKRLSIWSESKLLFARRTHRLSVDTRAVLAYHCQILAITTTIAFAFSYQVKEEDRMTGLPYQAYMVLLLVSSYSFMIDYLLLPSEFLDEWSLVEAERKRGILNYSSYILSSFLGQMPRGVLHVLLTLGPTFLIHSLNPAPMNTLFAFVCLVVGTEAWQAVIGICAVSTSHIAATNLLIFVSFGGGTLFGGLLIDSVTAVTQRALVVNDFLCCYLTFPCDGAAQEDDFLGLSSVSVATDQSNPFFNRDNACPTGIDNQRGNLGRAALEYMGLENVDNYRALFVLFAASIVFRMLTVVVLHLREFYSRKLLQI